MIRNLALALGLGMFLVAGTTVYAAGDAPKCKEKKLKETGKKAFSLLKAFGKNIKKNPDTKLGRNISKAESKFTKGFNKVENKGGCLTSGDSGDIEDKVNAFTFDVLCALEPGCPSSPSGAFLDVDRGMLD